MALSDVEVRVLGALMEKERTTPDGYPLSSQALVTACNQRTNREPVTDFHLQDVMAAVTRLRDRGLAETIQEIGDRVPKHKHRAARALDLDTEEFAVLAVLMLRGEQTPGELRARTERYVAFASVSDVERVLTALASRGTALTKSLGRSPGQSQDRWTHTLGTDEERLAPRVRPRFGSEGSGAREGGIEEPNGQRPSTSAPIDAQPVPTDARPAPGGAAPVTLDDYRELVRRLEALERRVTLLETGE